jgi:hypothetical protein
MNGLIFTFGIVQHLIAVSKSVLRFSILSTPSLITRSSPRPIVKVKLSLAAAASGQSKPPREKNRYFII